VAQKSFQKALKRYPLAAVAGAVVLGIAALVLARRAAGGIVTGAAPTTHHAHRCDGCGAVWWHDPAPRTDVEQRGAHTCTCGREQYRVWKMVGSAA
jgi:hypothetical protein